MINLQSTQGNIISVYEANAITRTQANAQSPEGYLVPQATLQVQYSRADYLLDGQGNRIGLVSRPNPGPDYGGFLTVTQEDLPELASGLVTLDQVDQLIRADLVKRSILKD